MLSAQSRLAARFQLQLGTAIIIVLTTIIIMAIIRTATTGTTIIVTFMGTTRTIVASGVTDWRLNRAIW